MACGDEDECDLDLEGSRSQPRRQTCSSGLRRARGAGEACAKGSPWGALPAVCSGEQEPPPEGRRRALRAGRATAQRGEEPPRAGRFWSGACGRAKAGRLRRWVRVRGETRSFQLFSPVRPLTDPVTHRGWQLSWSAWGYGDAGDAGHTICQSGRTGHTARVPTCMGGRTVTPNAARSPTPRTCVCVISRGRRDFADVVTFRILRWGDYSGRPPAAFSRPLGRPSCLTKFCDLLQNRAVPPRVPRRGWLRVPRLGVRSCPCFLRELSALAAPPAPTYP